MVELSCGMTRLSLAPEIGGSIARLSFAGRDILRAAPAVLSDPLDAACFPLIPYANRIANGEFRFEDRDVRLPKGFGTHALHGYGWRRPWHVTATAHNGVTIQCGQETDDWPWTIFAEQTFTVVEDGVRIRLRVRNDDVQAMPVSLGFHPFFPRKPMTTLDTSVGGVWLSNERLIPEKHVARSLFASSSDHRISQITETDNCYDGWCGRAAIGQPEANLAVTLTGSEALRFLHLYIPTDESFFCAEPVSAMPDAVNRPEARDITGSRILRPGESFAVEMEIRAVTAISGL